MIETITREEARTAYILHLMMWDELAGSGGGNKFLTKAYLCHHVVEGGCEFCYVCRVMNTLNNYVENCCRHCPSKIGPECDGSGEDCLGGLFWEWARVLGVDERKKYAAQIRDVELADWFKKLIDWA